MVLPNYARVRLLTNQYRDEGLSDGAIGYVIEIYDGGTNGVEYEVEFSRNDGTTIAQVIVKPAEIELAEEAP